MPIQVTITKPGSGVVIADAYVRVAGVWLDATAGAGHRVMAVYASQAAYQAGKPPDYTFEEPLSSTLAQALITNNGPLVYAEAHEQPWAAGGVDVQ